METIHKMISREMQRSFFAVLVAACLLAPALHSQTAPSGLKRITVSLSDVSINKIPFIIAENEGLYKKYGLDVVMTPFSSDAATTHGIDDWVPKETRDAVRNANISIGGGSPGMVSKGNAENRNDRVILATTDHIVHWDVVAQKQYKSIQELKGKRFAISSRSACTGTIALIMARRYGWEIGKDMILVPGDYSYHPLEKNEADALIAYEVPLAMAMKAGYRPLEDVKMRSWNEPIPCNGVWASKSWAHANHDAVIGYLKAVLEAIAMMKKDKEVAFRAISKYYKMPDREQQQVIYNGAAEMPKVPYPAVEGIKNAMTIYDSPGLRRYKLEDFYDDSFMKEIEQSGFVDNLYK
jgi:ABC-type nitrate/sulfonate/bicarbonate transport system substrate-binding protein